MTVAPEGEQNLDEVADPLWLPVTWRTLAKHFAPLRRATPTFISHHLRYYRESLARYHAFCSVNRERAGLPLQATRLACQVEKDERFWIAAAMLRLFHGERPAESFAQLLRRAGIESPLADGRESWEQALQGTLRLYFEPNLPSPRAYSDWLRTHLAERQPVRYVRESAAAAAGGFRKVVLEGPTNVDALLLNENSGLAVLFEAKVLSDISSHTSYDAARSQLARYVDAMLESNERLAEPLCRRRPESSFLVLVTPELFRASMGRLSRLYGAKFDAYKSDAGALAADLPHREARRVEWREVTRRLGWATWEDYGRIDARCCSWLPARASDGASI